MAASRKPRRRPPTWTIYRAAKKAVRPGGVEDGRTRGHQERGPTSSAYRLRSWSRRGGGDCV